MKTVIDINTGITSIEPLTTEEASEYEANRVAEAAAQAAWEAEAPRRAILAQIKELEASVTPRRLREAVLGDNGWLNGVNAQIAALRAKL